MLFVFLSKGKLNTGGGGGLKEAGINLKVEGKLAIGKFQPVLAVVPAQW